MKTKLTVTAIFLASSVSAQAGLFGFGADAPELNQNPENELAHLLDEEITGREICKIDVQKDIDEAAIDLVQGNIARATFLIKERRYLNMTNAVENNICDCALNEITTSAYMADLFGEDWQAYFSETDWLAKPPKERWIWVANNGFDERWEGENGFSDKFDDAYDQAEAAYISHVKTNCQPYFEDVFQEWWQNKRPDLSEDQARDIYFKTVRG